MAIRRMKGTLRWLPIEEIHGCPNPITSAVEVRKRWDAAARATKPGADTPRQYYCYFCGRPMKSLQAIYGHGRHCQKKKAYRAAMKHGIDFTVGSKTYNVRTRRFKVLRTILKLETHLAAALGSGEMTAREAERIFFFYVKGVSDARGRSFIRSQLTDADRAQTADMEDESGADDAGNGENAVEITEVPTPPEA